MIKQESPIRSCWLIHNTPRIYVKFSDYNTYHKYNVFKIFPQYKQISDPLSLNLSIWEGYTFFSEVRESHKIGPVDIKADFTNLTITLSAPRKDSVALLHMTEQINDYLIGCKYELYNNVSTMRP